MADLVGRAAGLAMVLGAALTVSACGSGDRADETGNTFDDANLMLEEPANDQSALEAAANATDLEPVANADTPADGNVVGETEGGDTGGNTVENDVTGM